MADKKNSSKMNVDGKTLVWGALIAVVVVVIAVGVALNSRGGGTAPGTTTAMQNHTMSTIAPSIFSVNYVYNSTVGNYLTNATGWTLYTYAKDSQYSTNSSCYGTCAAYWPSFYAGSLTLPAGLNAPKFGTITRVGGAKQTTYNGWPLYLYSGDKAAGQLGGQGFGRVWYAALVQSR